MNKVKSLVSYRHPKTDEERLGVCINDSVYDFAAGCNSIGSGEVPSRMLEFVRNIEALRPHLQVLVEKKSEVESKLKRGDTLFALKDLKLLSPLTNPGKIVHTAGNFREHAREGKEGGWEFQIPPWISFLKSTSAIIGHEDDVLYPPITRKLDHEIEVAIIIGKQAKYVSEDDAWEHIAGFTVFNDITARDLQRKEMSSGLLNLGKNLDSFAPFGPAMVLPEDIGDVHNLAIELRVNGEPRQVSNTNRLSVRIPEIVSHWSVLTLNPGDIVTTGTVSGVAAFRPNPEAYFLKPGDVMEAEVQNIGVLRNGIIAEELSASDKAWLGRRSSLFES